MKRWFCLFILLVVLGAFSPTAQGNPFEDSSTLETQGTHSSNRVQAAPAISSDLESGNVAPPPSVALEAKTGVSSKTFPVSDFLIIGHMGAPMEEADNTIESFQKAIELGANAVETDICITKDRYIVHWHDWDPDETIANLRQLGKQGLKYRPYCPCIWEKFRRPLSTTDARRISKELRLYSEKRTFEEIAPSNPNDGGFLQVGEPARFPSKNFFRYQNSAKQKIDRSDLFRKNDCASRKIQS